MELTSNLLQFLVTLLGFCLAAILYHQNRRQAYFLLACFYGCFALGSVSAAVFRNAAGFLCVGVWVDRKRDFSPYSAICPVWRGRTRFQVPRRMDFPPRWRSADGAVLRLWRHSPQSDLVRPGDGSRLRLHTWACLREGADWTRPGYAVFSHRGLVLCRCGKCPLDFWLPLAERRHFGALLLV